MVPLGACRAERFHLGRVRVVQESLVVGRFDRDQGDFSLGIVVDSPAVAFRERRDAKVRVALAQESLALSGPARPRDVVKGGIHLKGNVLLGVCEDTTYFGKAFNLSANSPLRKATVRP